GGAATAVLVIQDNENVIQFAATNYVVSEGVSNAVVNVARLGSAGSVSVAYATADNTAQSPADYIGVTNILTFAEGETNKAFTVRIIDDAVGEGAERINLSLSNPVGAALGTPINATLTIIDNDVQYGTL